MKPEITTRAELIDALRTASELEHQLMAQYLFAVYSMKRYTWEGLDAVQLERVRRWSSSITLIARQEMEHLGLALNLLSAIGGTPSFTRPNMPQRADYYGKAGIKLALTRGNLDTIKRFQRFEAPDLLTKKLKPEVPVSQYEARKWCHNKDEETTSRAMLDAKLTTQAHLLRASGTPALATSAPVLGFGWSSVQELYEAIRDGFDFVASAMGEKKLFVGRPSLQIFGGPAGSQEKGSMDDLNQYDVDLIEVKDLASAKMAITMILEQGEGISVNPSYLRWTHFCLFTGIRGDMEEHRLGELAARPVVRNPMTSLYPDVERSEVTLLTNPHTIRVSRIFNESYELMLLLLLYLYSDNVKNQKQVTSLMDAAFFPLMTMFIRPLAEILTELPAFKSSRETSPDGMRNAGPGFELNGDVLLFPAGESTWALFQERFDTIVGMYDELLRKDPWIRLPNQRESGFEKSRIWRRLEYMRSNMQRLATDWRANWLNIGITTQ